MGVFSGKVVKNEKKYTGDNAGSALLQVDPDLQILQYSGENRKE